MPRLEKAHVRSGGPKGLEDVHPSRMLRLVVNPPHHPTQPTHPTTHNPQPTTHNPPLTPHPPLSIRIEKIRQAYAHFAHALKLESNNTAALKGRQAQKSEGQGGLKRSLDVCRLFRGTPPPLNMYIYNVIYNIYCKLNGNFCCWLPFQKRQKGGTRK